MTDRPYNLDYLQRVIDCGWASNWIVCILDLRVPSSGGSGVLMNVALSFPDMSGGTPGFQLSLSNVILPSFSPAPYRITAASLNGPLTTAAGAGLTGFAVRNFPGSGSRGNRNCEVWIKLNRAMPSSPFRVRFAYTSNSGSGDIELMYVAGVKNIKAGSVLSGPNPIAIGDACTVVSIQQGGTNGGDTSRTFDFLVHPDTLQIDPPTG